MVSVKLLAPLLFFILGALSKLFKSHLEIPQPIAKAMALFLLIAIGLKGGVEVSNHPLQPHTLLVFLVAIILSIGIPILWFYFIKTKIDLANAAAIAATYGSVSAITFVTAANFLDALKIHYDGYFIAVMALMEGPPIIVGVLLFRLSQSTKSHRFNLKTMLHESFLNQAVFLLIGSLIIGTLIGEKGFKELTPFFDAPFKGILCLFLLDMGIVVARRLPALRKLSGFLLMMAIVAPLINASFGIVAAYLIGLDPGNALLLAILAAGASYIAVPAALSVSMPEADQAIYITMSLAITFPFNVLVGIPLYFFIIQSLWS